MPKNRMDYPQADRNRAQTLDVKGRVIQFIWLQPALCCGACASSPPEGRTERVAVPTDAIEPSVLGDCGGRSAHYHRYGGLHKRSLQLHQQPGLGYWTNE